MTIAGFLSDKLWMVLLTYIHKKEKESEILRIEKEINSKNESDFYPQMVTYLTEKMNKVVVKADFMKRNDFFQKHSDSEEDENQESTQIKEQE